MVQWIYFHGSNEDADIENSLITFVHWFMHKQSQNATNHGKIKAKNHSFFQFVSLLNF